MNCDKLKQLSIDYLDGTIGVEDKAAVDDHLAHCPECRQELEAFAFIRHEFKHNLVDATANIATPAFAYGTIKHRIAQEQRGSRFHVLSSIKARVARWWRGLRARPVWQQACVLVPMAAVLVGSGATAAIIGFGARGGAPSTYPYDIIFVSNQYGENGSHQDIYAIDADGGNTVDLTGYKSLDYMPAWSPDGSKIAFSSERDDNAHSEIYVMNSDGSNPVRLTYTSTNNQYDDNKYPSWSPDGNRIAFIAERGPDSYIYVMDADGTNQTRLTTNGDELRPLWSPDGTKIAYESHSDIWVMDADGSNKTKLTNHEGQVSMHHAWSPDGSKIAYISWIDDRGSDIYIMDANGSNVTYLASIDFGFPYPVWSPDGTKIAFAGEAEGERHHEIYLIDADGSNHINLTNTSDTRERDPSWSPDGTKIAYSLSGRSEPWEGNRGSEIWVMNADGSNQTKLTRSEENAHSPLWSPLLQQQEDN